MSHVAEERPVSRLYESGGSGRDSGAGGGGAGEFDRFIRQAIRRLKDEGISVDPAFRHALGEFLAGGLERAQRDQTGLDEIEEQWERLVSEVISFAQENDTTCLSADIFRRIHDRLCPGFYPFC